jgi:hypothetical protein
VTLAAGAAGVFVCTHRQTIDGGSTGIAPARLLNRPRLEHLGEVRLSRRFRNAHHRGFLTNHSSLRWLEIGS